MKSYRGTYRKVDGKLRRMHFVKLTDLPRKFLTSKSKAALKKYYLGNGLELVWDLDNNDFRVFNWKTIKGVLKEVEAEVNF